MHLPQEVDLGDDVVVAVDKQTQLFQLGDVVGGEGDAVVGGIPAHGSTAPLVQFVIVALQRHLGSSVDGLELPVGTVDVVSVSGEDKFQFVAFRKVREGFRREVYAVLPVFEMTFALPDRTGIPVVDNGSQTDALDGDGHRVGSLKDDLTDIPDIEAVEETGQRRDACTAPCLHFLGDKNLRLNLCRLCELEGDRLIGCPVNGQVTLLDDTHQTAPGRCVVGDAAIIVVREALIYIICGSELRGDVIFIFLDILPTGCQDNGCQCHQ